MEYLRLRFLRNIVEVGTKKLDALDVVLPVQLLVYGVGAVGRAAHRQQKHVLASGLLKSQGNRDTVSMSATHPQE
jgi:hypothetical protein